MASPTPVGSQRRRAQVALRLALAVVAIAYALFPVAWILSASLDPANTLMNQQLVPRHASLDNYRRLLTNPSHPFLTWMWNSLKVSTITAVASVLLTAMAAYVFSRFRFRGRRPLFVSILLIQIFPNLLAMVALYLLVQQLGNYVPWLGLNTHGGLILVYLGGVLGFNMFLIKGFFDQIPQDLDDAALVDGATHFQVLWRIVLPLGRPILAVVGILVFISSYSDFVLASILLTDTEQYTLAVGLSLFISGQFTQQWGVFAAGALIGALPIVLFFLLLQDYLVGGLVSGSTKG